MNLDQATKIVIEAIEQRKKWGKNYTHGDLDPVFLDALVTFMAAPSVQAVNMADTIAAQHEEIVLLKRQLGAAKSRETGLRQRLANLEKALPGAVVES